MGKNDAPATRSTGGRLGRRALLATATLGACAVAGGVVVAKGPEVANYEVDQFLHNELSSLEGVGIEDAIAAAQLTQKLVQVIVLPVANLVSLLGSGALQILIDALSRAQQGLGIINIHIDALGALQSLLQTWQSGITSLPVAMDKLTTADINSAVKYLQALQTKVNTSNNKTLGPGV